MSGAMRGQSCEVIDRSDESTAVAQDAPTSPQSAVIAHENGQSSTPQLLDSITTAAGLRDRRLPPSLKPRRAKTARPGEALA